MVEKKEEYREELLVPAPGRLVYMGQGQMHYVHVHKGTPDPLWPKKKKRRKKKAPQPPPAQTRLGCRDRGIPVEKPNGPFQGHPSLLKRYSL
jgi:hypothetical protein